MKSAYGSMWCEFCRQYVSASGGGVHHMRAHVRRGQAEELVKTLSDGSTYRYFKSKVKKGVKYELR